MSSHPPKPREADEENTNRTAEIAAFENGSPLTCSEIPNLCRDFPDSCACKHLRDQRLWMIKELFYYLNPKKQIMVRVDRGFWKR